MIYAEFIYAEKLIKKFRLSGHAESGPFGHDLVCSAVSALSIGTVNNLTRIATIEPKISANEDEGGFLEVTLPDNLKVDQKEKAEILLQSLYYSLSDIEQEYGKYISISTQK